MYVFTYNGQNKVLFCSCFVFVHHKSLLCLLLPLFFVTLRGATLITSSNGAQSKGKRERLLIICSYLAWGLMLQHDTHTHTHTYNIIHSVHIEMYLKSPSPPLPPTQLLNSKVSKKFFFSSRPDTQRAIRCLPHYRR